MRFSIEGRVPFLDYNLLKTVFSMNDEAIKAMRERSLLQYLLRRRVDYLVDDPKQIVTFMDRFAGDADWMRYYPPLEVATPLNGRADMEGCIRMRRN